MVARTTHGHTTNHRRSPTYVSWKAMLRRCYNQTYPDFHRYGGRGIRVFWKWRQSFEAFLYDMGIRPAGMTLDRINNEGDYTPENCRWATRREQNRNSYRTQLITINGKTQHLLDWASEYGIPESTLRLRIKQGWSEQDLLRVSSWRKKHG